MGSFEGEGEFKCFSGAWYKGQWSRGLRHGQVVMTHRHRQCDRITAVLVVVVGSMVI